MVSLWVFFIGMVIALFIGVVIGIFAILEVARRLSKDDKKNKEKEALKKQNNKDKH